MAKRLLLLALVLTGFGQNLLAQKHPHLEGEIHLSVKKGTISGNFHLSNLPPLGKHYSILLNRGLNLYLLKDSLNQVLDYAHDYVKLDYEALEYWLAHKTDTLLLPSRFSVSYVGAFPVYSDTLNSFDDMGVMAFNGKTFRATNQTRWYPVVRDTKNEKVLDEVTYRIKVVCPDCKAIYINGSQVQVASQALLSSDKSTALTIFAGDYGVQLFDNVTFLNTTLSNKQASVFDRVVRSIQEFYTAKLKIPYKQRITFLKHQPIEKFNEGRSWGFVNFPTIAVAGVGYEEQVTDSDIRDSGTFAFYAHELGHYYFGTVLRPNAELAPFFTESTTEYLCLKAAEHRYGKNYTKHYIDEKRKILKDRKLTPLNRITKAEDVMGDYYRYSFGPLLLLGLESIVGEQKMYDWLHHILGQNGQRTDYHFFKRTALEAGISRQQWQQFEDSYVQIETASAIFTKLPLLVE